VLQLASVQIDPALGDIDVQAGTLSLQGNMPSLGNAANNLIVFGGAILQFATVGNEINKALTLKDGGIVNNSGGANTYDGPVNLQGTALFNVAGVSLLFTNVISGTGSLSKVTGTLPMSLSASNTYTGDTVISAGTLLLNGDGSISHSRSINVAATLDVSGRTDGALTWPGGRSLSGVGTINGTLIASAGSTVSPGANSTSIGTLSVNGDATLSGTNVMKLNATSLTSDNLAVGGTVNYGGTLKLTNLSGTLSSGNSFQLFTAGTYNGTFASIVPATPGNGLSWNTNQLSSGILSVGGIVITNFTLSGSSLTIEGLGGNASSQYAILTSTNVALPVNQWTPIATNTFDGSGNFSFTTNIATGLPQQYFQLRAP